ncbi:hypothetical protein [Aequorivita sp. CIP111184]|uniref:hypothetical protein n=1 Tax=Aequorivita sp. CIP111184 TaxID=2211356 RepID=UPI000DBC017F|nr:hypothetical protein [Aequorivita sp. CIP111184]SRX54267.1 hypothetical protein AEQU1_01276 [Aequorivita sp. CIP111184]
MKILKITEVELPFEGTTTLQIPSAKDPIFSIRKYHDTDFFETAVDELKIDRDGTLTSKEIFSEKPFNVQLANSIRSCIWGLFLVGFQKPFTSFLV